MIYYLYKNLCRIHSNIRNSNSKTLNPKITRNSKTGSPPAIQVENSAQQKVAFAGRLVDLIEPAKPQCPTVMASWDLVSNYRVIKKVTILVITYNPKFMGLMGTWVRK